VCVAIVNVRYKKEAPSIETFQSSFSLSSAKMDGDEPLDLSVKSRVVNFQVKHAENFGKKSTEWVAKLKVLLKYPKCFQHLTKDKIAKLKNYR
jgi:hypothetical protein